MRTLTTLFICLMLSPACCLAQRKKAKGLPPPPTEEELRQEAAERRYEEMLDNTRSITVIDSLVTDKDAFLSQLRLTSDVGRFSDPQRLFSANEDLPATGHVAFVNALSSAVYYTQADTSGNYRLFAAFRNGSTWTPPAPLEGIEPYPYADYPFVQADGATLYFAAESEDGLGGLDLYVTRFNRETQQYVRPENMGFPFNSTANDYLLATDETSGVALLVTDRRQPDDKVCLYWLSLKDVFEGAPYNPPADVDDPDSLLRAYAEISSVAATQTDAKSIDRIRRQWKNALEFDATDATHGMRFIINDHRVYTSLSQFKNADARKAAEQWMEAMEQKKAVESELAMLRRNYATTRSEKSRKRISNLENAAANNLQNIRQLEKTFRRLEVQSMDVRP